MTQQERSAATREALLDATIECLTEVGYDAATTLEISERAGLSRGAHLHHFQTRASLLSAAVEALAERGAGELAQGVERLPAGARRHGAALDMLWKLFSGPLYKAVLELAIHARTDPELRAGLEPVEQMVGREAMPMLRLAFAAGAEDRSLDDVIAVVLATIRGMAILPLLTPGHPGSDAAWKRSRFELLEMLARNRGTAPTRVPKPVKGAARP
jgi:AcrR family transcriptional regulator